MKSESFPRKARAQEQGGYGVTDPLAGKVLQGRTSRAEKRRQNQAKARAQKAEDERLRKLAKGDR